MLWPLFKKEYHPCRQAYGLGHNVPQAQCLVSNISCSFQIHETVETISQLKTNREFFLSFAKDPQEFINNWLISQTRDLKVKCVDWIYQAFI